MIAPGSPVCMITVSIKAGRSKAAGALSQPRKRLKEQSESIFRHAIAILPGSKAEYNKR